MSLEVIRGGHDLDAYEQLVDALRRVIEQIVEEMEGEKKPYSWPWLTVEEAAKKFGITTDAVRRRVRENRLPGVTYGGRVYVDLELFDVMLREYRRQR